MGYIRTKFHTPSLRGLLLPSSRKLKKNPQDRYVAICHSIKILHKKDIFFLDVLLHIISEPQGQ
jgi:hypothetical protein